MIEINLRRDKCPDPRKTPRIVLPCYFPLVIFLVNGYSFSIFMNRTHINQRKLKRHFPFILTAVLVSLAVSFLYFKWYDLKPIKTPVTNTFEYLMEGNRRFVAGHPRHPDESLQHRQKMAQGQNPLAVVVTCSDSRVSPELIFDQGIGDLFVIRTAGTLLSQMELGSIEFAVEHLGVKTIVIMGHEECGAIKALLSDEIFHGHIQTIIDSLRIENEIQYGISHHDLPYAIKANVIHQTRALKSDFQVLFSENKNPPHIDIKGVLYSLKNGKVELLDDFEDTINSLVKEKN